MGWCKEDLGIHFQHNSRIPRIINHVLFFGQNLKISAIVSCIRDVFMDDPAVWQTTTQVSTKALCGAALLFTMNLEPLLEGGWWGFSKKDFFLFGWGGGGGSKETGNLLQPSPPPPPRFENLTTVQSTWYVQACMHTLYSQLTIANPNYLLQPSC